MDKHDILKEQLRQNKTGKMKAFGNSMLPLIESGSLLTYEAKGSYDVGDIVFCKVKGRYISAHKIVAKEPAKGYKIANNTGYINGWTHTVFGKVITAEYNGRTKKF
jgi:phage repressor protein C with HTH and peptisase S24 domain